MSSCATENSMLKKQRKIYEANKYRIHTSNDKYYTQFLGKTIQEFIDTQNNNNFKNFYVFSTTRDLELIYEDYSINISTCIFFHDSINESSMTIDDFRDKKICCIAKSFDKPNNGGVGVEAYACYDFMTYAHYLVSYARSYYEIENQKFSKKFDAVMRRKSKQRSPRSP